MTTATHMRAAVYVPGNNELVLQHVPIPTPGPQQVLLKIAASGVCHSDTFVLSGALPDPRTYILGHENVGYAVQYVLPLPIFVRRCEALTIRTRAIARRLGSEVQGITVGELYAIWDVIPCALAHPSTTLSPAFNTIGLGKNGGFAEYIVVNQAELLPVVRSAWPRLLHASPTHRTLYIA